MTHQTRHCNCCLKPLSIGPFVKQKKPFWSSLISSSYFSPVCGKGEKRPRVLSRSDWKKALVKLRGKEEYLKAIAESNKV